MTARRIKGATSTRPLEPGRKNRSSNPLPAIILPTPGRKPLYKPEYDELIRRVYLLGYEDGEVAELMGIELRTLHNWLHKYPSLFQARANGKEIADAEVVESLRQRALGYKHRAKKIMLGPGGQVITEEYDQHYPPDTKAAELWLFNRQSKRWKPRQAVDDPGEGGTTIKITGGLPDDE